MKKFFSVFSISFAQKVLFFVLLFSAFGAGMYARPGFDLVADTVDGYFNPKFERPLSEYEQAVNDLWQSEKHQYTCKANAAAFVSLELANKYLNETKKQQLIAEYELPETLVKEMAKTK
jgi:hypothetical protein